MHYITLYHIYSHISACTHSYCLNHGTFNCSIYCILVWKTPIYIPVYYWNWGLPLFKENIVKFSFLSIFENSGTSPCKRFVRRLLSPVVCGLPSPDRHGILHGSFTSLGSYDSGSIISESEDSFPHLFDFGSQELTEEMTRIDMELLIRIPWGELSILGWMSPDKVDNHCNFFRAFHESTLLNLSYILWIFTIWYTMILYAYLNSKVCWSLSKSISNSQIFVVRNLNSLLERLFCLSR